MRRRRQAEWQEQAKLATLLAKLLDPAYIFWTAVDNTPWSLPDGIRRKSRGIKRGVPDVLLWFDGRTVAIEMKSQTGKLSREQREVRDAMQRVGIAWHLCRSAQEALDVLRAEGVPFRDDVQTSSQQPRISATMRI